MEALVGLKECRRFKMAAAALAMSSLAASPVVAQYKRDSEATGYFCKGLFFSSCSSAPIDALSQYETSQRFPIEQLFGFVTSYDPDEATCWVNNAARFGDPQYHAHARRKEGSWIYLGIPSHYTFSCSAYQ